MDTLKAVVYTTGVDTFSREALRNAIRAVYVLNKYRSIQGRYGSTNNIMFYKGSNVFFLTFLNDKWSITKGHPDYSDRNYTPDFIVDEFCGIQNPMRNRVKSTLDNESDLLDMISEHFNDEWVMFYPKEVELELPLKKFPDEGNTPVYIFYEEKLTILNCKNMLFAEISMKDSVWKDIVIALAGTESYRTTKRPHDNWYRVANVV